MEALLALAGFFLFIFVCKKLSGFFFRAADYFDEKEQRKLYNERCIRESLEDIRDSVKEPEEEPIDYKQRLLEANQVIVEKNKLKEAMKNELDIQ